MSERDRVRLKQSEESLLQQEERQLSSSEAQQTAVSSSAQSPAQNILGMQRSHGNQAVRRFISSIQRSTLEEGGPLNDEVSGRINSKRGGGSSLDGSVQAEMSQKMDFDFSGVKVHTDSESDTLNRQLGAKAFTTGSDVFFRGDTYNPGSAEGKELIAHELTHVVQQQGSAPSGNLTLGPANDSYESQADQMASQAVSAPVQPKREEAVQAKRDDVQRQEMPEQEEEMVQTKRDDVQREAVEEEEAVQAKRDNTVQRQAEEEEAVQAKRDNTVQREAVEEEEEAVQAKRDDVQRESEEEEALA